MAPEILISFQSVFLALLFVSTAFGLKSNYLVHVIIMIVAVVVGWLAVVMTIPDFMNSSYTQTITNPASTFVVVGSHLFLGIATLVSGTWLIALWRPRSTEFAAKSKRIWQSNVILWVLAYVVGLLVFVTLHTTLFG